MNRGSRRFHLPFASNLRDALPNALFIGFTGTLIEKTDASARAVFGDYIFIDDIQRAVAGKAKSLLTQFVSRHERTIAKKVAIIVEHFQASMSDKLGGKAKAMIVTSSRLHAVRYKLVDAYLKNWATPTRRW